LIFIEGIKQLISCTHMYTHIYIYIFLSLSLSYVFKKHSLENRRHAERDEKPGLPGKVIFPSVCRCGVKGDRTMRNFVDGADKSARSSPLDDTMRAEETVPRHDRLCHYCVTYKAPSRRRTPHTNETASRWLLQNPRKKRPTGHVMYSRIRARVVSCGS